MRDLETCVENRFSMYARKKCKLFGSKYFDLNGNVRATINMKYFENSLENACVTITC